MGDVLVCILKTNDGKKGNSIKMIIICCRIMHNLIGYSNTILWACIYNNNDDNKQCTKQLELRNNNNNNNYGPSGAKK